LRIEQHGLLEFVFKFSDFFLKRDLFNKKISNLIKIIVVLTEFSESIRW
jgi:hypothetical protein